MLAVNIELLSSDLAEKCLSQEDFDEKSDSLKKEMKLKHPSKTVTLALNGTEYSAVCEALVKKFPCLADSGDCKYVRYLLLTQAR